MVWATVALTIVIKKTPRKLKTAAIKIAGFGAIARVETQVAIAFGASVQPFTSTTASVKSTVMHSAGFVNNCVTNCIKEIVIILSYLLSPEDSDLEIIRHNLHITTELIFMQYAIINSDIKIEYKNGHKNGYKRRGYISGV